MSFPPSRNNDILGENSLQENDILGGNLLHESDEEWRVTTSQRLVIAIDYGTTFTSLAFAYTDSGVVDIRNIEILQDWTPKMSNSQRVPSLISYTQAPNGEAQWGIDISNNAIAMVNTKLELELQPSLFDELDLTLNVLKQTGNLAFEHLRKAVSNPAYTYKSPTEIVTDYLTKIYECTRATIDIDMLAQTKTGIDIVVTVPVNWSYEANNATFKAVRGAGFNKTNFPTLQDIILVSEPEAASHLVARDLQANSTELLRINDCFIVCDAGATTVDVVAFQVKRTVPYFEFEKVTDPKSGRCGSAAINTVFKAWLRDQIGVERYAELDPSNARKRLISTHAAESGPMRELIRRFEDKKKIFSNTSQDIFIELPAPLNRLSIKKRVNEGELIIFHNEMKELINSCVGPITGLIADQIGKVVAEKSRRTKNIFLIGGFGTSPYLQEELHKSLDMRNMRMYQLQSDKSSTAVVEGGVIYGIEKSRHTDANYMSAMTRSYGICVEGNFEWLVRKGDLILSREARSTSSVSFRIPRNEMANYELPVYVYSDEDGEDEVPARWQYGQHEVELVGVVKCEFSRYMDTELRQGRMHGYSNLRMNNTLGPLKCQIQVSSTELEATVFLEKVPVGRHTIKIEVEPPQRYSMDKWD